MATSRASKQRRRIPRQARAQATVAVIVEAAARLFRREGWEATTNRIAETAGVSIGSLYEYFPDKQALLFAVAERHLEEAERHILPPLQSALPVPQLLASLQRGIMGCQAYPSMALDWIADPVLGAVLRERADRLRQAVLAALCARATLLELDEPQLRAEATFDAIGPLTARALFQRPDRAEALSRHYLSMGINHFAQ